MSAPPHPNGVPVFNLTRTAHSTLPSWVVKKTKKKLRDDPRWRGHVDLIQDLEFPEACLRLALTRDERHVVATGVYKPQMRVFALQDLSLKFERHTTMETVAFRLLGDDWKKVALLQADRNIELHTQFGLHFSVRIPKFGRDLAYQERTCDLLAVGASSQVYRLNLEQGTFLRPWDTSLPSANALALCQAHDLAAVAGDDGVVEFWDSRYRHRVSSIPHSDTAATAVRFFPGGVHCAVGTGDGMVHLYDMRNPAPLLRKDHQYGYAVHRIEYHEDAQCVVSADKKAARIWRLSDASPVACVEPGGAVDINDVLLQQKTGLVMLGVEDRSIQTFFVPSLGPAPGWCTFLEDVVDGSAGQSVQSGIFDSLRFVAPAELALLGLQHLVGSDRAIAYMHGYFLDRQLVEEARARSAAATAEEARAQQAAAKLAAESATRVPFPGSSVAVNRALSDRLEERASALRADERFRSLFTDRDFEVDEQSEAFLRQRPRHSQPKERQEGSLPGAEAEAETEGRQRRRTTADGYSTDEDGDPAANRVAHRGRRNK